MKKLLILLAVMLSVGIVSATMSRTGDEPSIGIKEGYEVLCEEGTPQEIWQDGELLHIRRQTNIYQTFSDSVVHTCTNQASVNVIMNLSSSNGVVWGTYKSEPNDPGYANTNSAWEGFFYGRLKAGLFSGRGLGYGTGKLAGWQMRTLKTEELPFDSEHIPSGLCGQGNDPLTMLRNTLLVTRMRED